jgi:hypothetical protein
LRQNHLAIMRTCFAITAHASGYFGCVANREASHQYEYDNDNEHVINYFSNNQMALHLQAEDAHISKQINKIMTSWNVTNLSERNDAR